MYLKQISIFTCILILINIESLHSENIIIFNKEKIFKIANNYITTLQKTINQKSDDYTGEILDCFNDTVFDLHAQDLNDLIKDEFIFAYFEEAKSNTKINTIEIDIEQCSILDCTYNSNITGKQFAFIRVPKTISYKMSNKKESYNHILMIDITSSEYKISDVLSDDIETEELFLSNCAISESDTNKQKEILNLSNKLYAKATDLFSNKQYFKALEVCEKILSINPSYVDAIDGEKIISSFITIQLVNTRISETLSKRNLSEARKTLEMVKKYVISQPSEITNWEAQIRNVEYSIRLDIKFKEAESYFSSELYQKALPLYIELKSKNYYNFIVNERIDICKDSDPNLIRKRLKKAYDAVSVSKKNYNSTFKTYYKYENSGLLSASNYHFMSLMMLDNGKRKLLKELGMTTNQSQNLAVKYFFKARYLGYNNKDIEIQVFTKNFLKKLKN